MTITQITVTVAAITPKTRWTFVEVTTEDGIVGTGEASLNGQEPALMQAADRLLCRLPGTPVHVEALQARSLPTTLAETAVRSALDQAVRDVAARVAGLPLWRGLGPAHRAEIPVYANINRRTVDRSPESFADSARTALAGGHEAFKMAPFDEATSEARAAGALGPAIDLGFKRVAAVRDAIGPEQRLMVDCHWRFDESAAEAVIGRAAELGLHWVECPIPETPDALSTLRRLRGIANAAGVRLAGCEEAIGEAGFAPFLKAGAYDVVMPDVKYVGGLDQLMRLAEAALRSGVLVSPHNPSGPVSHAVSLHVSSVVPSFDRLEMQFDESPLFPGLASETLPAISHGVARLPAGPGTGLTLDAAALAACTVQRAVFGTDGTTQGTGSGVE